MIQQIKLGCIGVGNMASAIIASVADSGLVPLDQIMLADIFPKNLEIFAEAGMKTGGNTDVARFADVVILAVKPQQLAVPLAEIAPYCENKVLLSICAGVHTDTIRAAVPGAAVMRAMPNLPISVHKGMTAVFYGDAPHWARETLNDIFTCAGIIQEMPEELFDIATAICGSGPAYFYYLAAAAAEWFGGYGVNRDIALRMLLQTMDGAVTTMITTGEQPEELIAKVMSKGGTTQAALEAFEQHGLAGAFTAGLTRCVERAGELNEQQF